MLLRIIGMALIFPEDLLKEKIKLDLKEEYELLQLNSYEKAVCAINQLKNENIDYFLGDDSGIFIEALNYFPGVHSRRWIGKESIEDDLFRCQKILDLMKNKPNRKTFLISNFSLVDKNGKEITNIEVKNEFKIDYEIHEGNGFGYDSILVPEAYMVTSAYENEKLTFNRSCEIIKNRLTISDLNQYEKNVITNRGRIAKTIYDVLNKNYAF